MNEVTSESVAKIAARGLRNPELLSFDEIRRVCASALTQAPDRKKTIIGAVVEFFKGKQPSG